MKKTLAFLLLILLLCSCNIEKYPLKPGIYESKEVTINDYFSKAKYMISEIDEQTFISANLINVIKDGGTSGRKQKYYSFNLFFFIDSIDDYLNIDTRNFDFKKDSLSVYTATIEYYSDEFSISKSIVFDSHLNTMFWQEEKNNTTFEMRLIFETMR